jgi:peptide/nickel transport system substrate-binding protein
VRFHDGAPFDALAVADGLVRTLSSRSNSAPSADFYSLAGVEVTGPLTLTLAFPDGSARSWADRFLASWESTIAKPSPGSGLPVGAGPMRVVAYEPGRTLSLQRNDEHWNADQIALGGLHLVHLGRWDTGAGLAALGAGRLDLVQVDPSEVPDADGAARIAERPGPPDLISLHTCKVDDPLNDARVRRALNKAIDREALIQTVFDGRATPATTPWPQGHLFDDPTLARQLDHDPSGARAELAETSHPDGIRFDLHVPDTPEMAAVAEELEEQFAQIGVGVDLHFAESPTDDLASEVPGARLVSIAAEEAALLGQWTGPGPHNACGYQDPRLDQKVSELRRQPPGAERAVELWQEIDAHVVDGALSVFVAFRPVLAAYDDGRFAALTLFPRGPAAVPDPYATQPVDVA